MNVRAEKKRYFIGANSSRGFVNFTSDIFCRAERLYIIKGAPGTGKSKLLNDIASEAENRSMDVEYYHCSSDPFSLDGVFIKDISAGIIDGTAPHTADMRFPGAQDEILYLGDFWDKDVLEKKTPDLISLNKKKAELFDSAYRLLSAGDAFYREKKALLSDAVDLQKLDAAIGRIFDKRTCVGDGWRMEPRQTEAIGMFGYTRFPTNEYLGSSIYHIDDRFGISSFAFNSIIEHAKKRGLTTYVSYGVLSDLDINEVYLPDTGVSFICEVKQPDGYKSVNMSRFINKETIKANRNKLRCYTKMHSEIIKETEKVFEDIKRIHFSIENIYSGAMNFKKKEEFSKHFLIELFS